MKDWIPLKRVIISPNCHCRSTYRERLKEFYPVSWWKPGKNVSSPKFRSASLPRDDGRPVKRETFKLHGQASRCAFISTGTKLCGNNYGLANVDRQMIAHILAKVDYMAAQSSKGVLTRLHSITLHLISSYN